MGAADSSMENIARLQVARILDFLTEFRNVPHGFRLKPFETHGKTANGQGLCIRHCHMFLSFLAIDIINSVVMLT